MSTYFGNNNNRAMYGNQNNMYGQQGGYPNSNNYGRQQYQGNYQNNYNAGNYNQNNYQNKNYNNQQSNDQSQFISAYMGRILISSQDLETFKKSIQSPDCLKIELIILDIILISMREIFLIFQLKLIIVMKAKKDKLKMKKIIL